MRKSVALIIAVFLLVSVVSTPSVSAAQVVVRSEKPGYAPGDLVVVSGEGPLNTPVAVQVLDPSGTPLVLLTATPDASGVFSRSFRLSANAAEGKYVIYASVPGFKARSSFQVKASVPMVPVEIVQFTLVVKEWGFNGTSGGPDIRVNEGDRVRIVLINVGARSHIWVLDASSPSPYTVGTDLVQSQESETIEFVASKPGEFTYYCSVPGHRAQGMEGKIIIGTVTPAPTPTATPTPTPKPTPTPTPTPKPPPVESKKPTVVEGVGKATLKIPSLDRGAKVELSFEKATGLSVKSLSLAVSNPVKDIEIDIRKEPQKPAVVTKNVPGKAFEYITIEPRNISEGDVSEAKIRFNVDKPWIASNRIDADSIRLHRFTTEWVSLPTAKIGEDAQTLTFEATSPGLSVFAVSGKVKTTLSLSVGTAQIDRGNPITVEGRLDPLVPGVPVVLTYTKAGGVEIERQATTDADGAFTGTFTPDAGGTWTVQAMWEGNDDYAGAASQRVTFEVFDRGCLIATATFGSELSDEVQFLRGFRESMVYSSFSGRSFMTAFNAFYYSFSPTVAQGIASDNAARDAAKVVLYPLLLSLQAAVATSNMPMLNGEVGMVLAGFVASSLIALVYLVPPAIAVGFICRRLGRHLPWSGFARWSLFAWIGNLVVLALAVVTLSSAVAIVSTSAFVISTMVLTASVALKGFLRSSADTR